MTYDTIIIGGGLSGLVAGIKLLQAGQSVAIVSSGQSSLHFNSGALSLLGHDAYGDIQRPLDAIEQLPTNHPYRKIGLDALRRFLPSVQNLLTEAGLKVSGEHYRNQYRLTPMGLFKPAWLVMDGYAAVPQPGPLCPGTTLILNLRGFLDFYPDFIAQGLSGEGSKCVIREFCHPKIDILHKNPTEMRAVNIARVACEKTIADIAKTINQLVKETTADAVVMPGIFGNIAKPLDETLRHLVNVPLYYVATMPISVCGSMAQQRLYRHFCRLGGQYLLGDTVTTSAIDGDRLLYISTKNLGNAQLKAKNFILASGSFIGRGLVSTPDSIVEPLFGLDISVQLSRDEWCVPDVYAAQPYMSVGVKTDSAFRPSINGRPVSNLYAIGAILGDCDANKEESGGGIAILSALAVAESLIK